MAGSVYNLINNEFDYADPYADGLESLGDDFYNDFELDESIYYGDNGHGIKQGARDEWVN